jgi:hypothetical protein
MRPVDQGGERHFASVCALYIGKTWEAAKTGKQTAEIEIANAKAEAG